jgi:hypothetical protein
MTPAMGLMKLIEVGLEKGGIRDSMATRQAKAAGGQAMQMANQPLMSPVGQNPLAPPAPQMSPVPPAIPQPATASPDMFDQIQKIVGHLGGGNMQGGMPMGGMPAALTGPGNTPNMGLLAQDFTARNQESGGLRGKLEKLIMMGMA